MSLREQTAEELRVALVRKRMSAAELARRLGWSQAYMARRYDGRIALDIDDLERIASVLDIEPASLIPAREPATRRYPVATVEYGTAAAHPVDVRSPRPRGMRARARMLALPAHFAAAVA